MKQIKVITPAHQPGTIADIAELLAARDVNILELDGTDDHAHGIVHMEAEPYDEALRALNDAGYHAVGEDVLVIRLEDRPGALARVAARFRDAQLNIAAMRIVRRDTGWATVIMSTDDNERAREIVADCLV